MTDAAHIGHGARARLTRLVATRVRWLHITTMENHRGSHDVVLRLDGSYANRSDAEHVAQFFLNQIQEGGELPEPRQ